jgi:hypothetical protein
MTAAAPADRRRGKDVTVERLRQIRGDMVRNKRHIAQEQEGAARPGLESGETGAKTGREAQTVIRGMDDAQSIGCALRRGEGARGRRNSQIGPGHHQHARDRR